MKLEETLTFNDVLLTPKFSTIKSRSEVDLSVVLCKNFKFKLPYIPANMKTIVGVDMLRETYKLGMLGILHRFIAMDEQIEIINELKKEFKDDIFNYIGISVGVKINDLENVAKWVGIGIKIICIDIAHLDSVIGLEMVKQISQSYPKVLLIAGNVATGEAAIRAWKAGADIVKVGIGASGICTTRMEAGAGVPQLSAIANVQEARKSLERELGRQLFFISDGGHRINADLVKSLCFADMVMIGGMLSGADETPSELININGQSLKFYSGSSTHKDNRIEGVKAAVKPKGPVAKIIVKMIEAVQSGCSYQNCKNLKELKENPTFIKITTAGLRETGIHDVIMVE